MTTFMTTKMTTIDMLQIKRKLVKTKLTIILFFNKTHRT